MGAFNDLFAPRNKDIPQISVLETVVHYAGTPLTAREIIEMSEVSRRAVYQILVRYVEDGVLVELPPEEGGRGKRFGLNPNDVRARLLRILEPLLAIGQLESELKREEGRPQKDSLPMSILNEGFDDRPNCRSTGQGNGGERGSDG